tara:strand:- start:3082 stop:3279 length:198 start_codon:yes stop_codon:yes gene_type:complete
MAFTKSADGVASKGKTKGKQLGISGPSVMGEKGASKKMGVSSMAMKDMGRNLARVANQKKSGRGR